MLYLVIDLGIKLEELNSFNMLILLKMPNFSYMGLILCDGQVI